MSPSEPVVVQALVAALEPHLARAKAVAVVQAAVKLSGMTPAQLEREGLAPALLAEVRRGLELLATSPTLRASCLESLRRLAATPGGAVAAPAPREIELKIVDEGCVVTVRSSARTLAQAVGFDHTGQIKIATAVSEVARNISSYAGGGVMRLQELRTPKRGIAIEGADQGPGIPNLEQILAGNYRSKTGMGLGLRGCRNLMDHFEIDTAPGKGTRILMRKYL